MVVTVYTALELADTLSLGVWVKVSVLLALGVSLILFVETAVTDNGSL